MAKFHELTVQLSYVTYILGFFTSPFEQGIQFQGQLFTNENPQ